MTYMFEQMVKGVRALPDAEQDAIAASVLAELEDDQRWEESFASSPEMLAELADEALAEHRTGRTMPLDPDRM